MAPSVLVLLALLLTSLAPVQISAEDSDGKSTGAGKKSKDGMKLFDRVQVDMHMQPHGNDSGLLTHQWPAAHAQTLSWSSDELLRIRDLHKKDFKDRQVFLNASNLAQYLGLAPVEAIHMPVPLNFVFVGFEADGNMGVNYTVPQLQRWFGHLDHVLPHSRIELAELSCVEDGYCAGLVHGHFQSKPVHSAVHLNFTCQVVMVKKRSVVAVFERAIHLFSRPVDPDLETGAQQVDATKMEAFVDHFVHSLGLSTQYTMVVLNPTWTASEPMYGYRQGVSQKELEYIANAGQDQVRSLLQQQTEPEPQLPYPHARGRWSAGGWFQGQNEDSKFHVNDATWSSEHWATEIDTYLQREEDTRSSLLKRVPAVKGAAAVVQAMRVLRRLPGVLSTTLREAILGDPLAAAAKLLTRFRTMHPAEDCLVGNWVSQKRWLMLDLTAAGSDWGPALGGEGVVHRHTLPRVSTYFSTVVDEKKDKRRKARFEGSHEAEKFKDFQMEKSQALASTSNAEYQAFMLKRQAWEREAQAPGAPPVDVKVELEKWGKKYRESLARAELDALERFALRHCHQQAYPPLMCADLKEDADRLRTQLAKMTSSGALTTELYPKHMWDIFGIGDHMTDEFMQVGEAAGRARSFFMAELSSALSRGIRHVIAPPTAVWRHDDKRQRHDTATPYAKRVTFEVYSIVESSRHAHNERPPNFDFETFQSQVNELRLFNGGHAPLPLQAFEFHTHTLNLLDEPSLSAAFAVSLHTSTQEIPSTDQYLEGDTERVFVDSRELAHHMRPLLLAKTAARRGEQNDREHLVVHVLVFQLERSNAVLIDEHYSAKALEDMVLVVQNAAREDEHPTGMMCNGALMSRPLSPLKEALSAVLVYLGGVLPPHLGYSPARQHVTHDWLWSTGAHPLSATSTGLAYTQIQKDALGRSYVLDALDASIERLNEGVAALQRAHTSHALHAHVLRSQPKVTGLLQRYDSIVTTWRSMVGHAFLLEYGQAAELIKALTQYTDEFHRLCLDVSTPVEHLQCKGRTRDPSAGFVGMLLTGSGAVAIAAALFAVFPRFRRAQKPQRPVSQQW